MPSSSRLCEARREAQRCQTKVTASLGKYQNALRDVKKLEAHANQLKSRVQRTTAKKMGEVSFNRLKRESANATEKLSNAQAFLKKAKAEYDRANYRLCEAWKAVATSKQSQQTSQTEPTKDTTQASAVVVQGLRKTLVAQVPIISHSKSDRTAFIEGWVMNVPDDLPEHYEDTESSDA
jgi:chromosome segregation ATPase